MSHFPSLHLPPAHPTLQFAVAGTAILVAALFGFAIGLIWPL
jgi:hypothetical protein